MLIIGPGFGHNTERKLGPLKDNDIYDVTFSPKGTAYSRASARKVDLPAFLITYTLQRAFPSARGSVTTASPHRSQGKSRNINRVCHRSRRSAET